MSLLERRSKRAIPGLQSHIEGAVSPNATALALSEESGARNRRRGGLNASPRRYRRCSGARWPGGCTGCRLAAATDLFHFQPIVSAPAISVADDILRTITTHTYKIRVALLQYPLCDALCVPGIKVISPGTLTQAPQLSSAMP